jgi:hypothetical protein
MKTTANDRRQMWLGITCLLVLGLFSFPGEAIASDPDPAPEEVTFAEDVAPILQENCETCHRPGSIGPMALRTYDEVRPWAEVIKLKVSSRLMPPWPLDRSIGIQAFKNDVSLSDEEIETIVRWVDAGSPMGDPAAMPPAREWPDYSQVWALEEELGKPEVVVTTDDYTVPANGLDQWFDSDVEIPELSEERWIRAVEIRPSNPDAAYVFHHGNSSLVQGEGRDDGSALIAAAVGKMYDILPSDAGIRLLPGAKITTGFHYFPIGREIEHATVDIALYLYPPGEKPKYVTPGASTVQADNTRTTEGEWVKISPVDAGGVRAVDLFIPPHGTAMLQGTWVVQKPTRIHSVRGHMHLRGKYQIVEAIYPDGRREVLNKLDWQHRWHTDFLYEDHAMPLLPKGTVVVLTSYFDNTAENEHNPDPDQVVVFGRRSVDEMSHIWIGRTFFEQAEFDQLVAEREEYLKTHGAAAEAGG